MYSQGYSKNKLHFPSVPSQQSRQSSHAQLNYYIEHKTSEVSQKQNPVFDLESLDIEPIENKHNDKFIIDEKEENQSKFNSESSKNRSNFEQQLQYLQSDVWSDVFYSRKTIMSLLQQRNDVCLMYNLTSKAISTLNQPKRIFTDSQLSQYLKQLFQESPSYKDYDQMSFTIISQVSSLKQEYFVFFACDDKFVPQCKVCNISTFLRLQILNGSQIDGRTKKNSIIKGKIICSNAKCKKKLLGEFQINQQEQKGQIKQTQFRNRIIKEIIKEKISKENKMNSQVNEEKLNQRQKMMIKKAAMKITM